VAAVSPAQRSFGRGDLELLRPRGFLLNRQATALPAAVVCFLSSFISASTSYAVCEDSLGFRRLSRQVSASRHRAIGPRRLAGTHPLPVSHEACANQARVPATPIQATLADTDLLQYSGQLLTGISAPT